MLKAVQESPSPSPQRLESLDVLRGMDMFLLTVLGPLVGAFARTGQYSWLEPVLTQFDHVAWEGFRLWDLIMPLFMFLSGVTIPFAYTPQRLQTMRPRDIALRMVRRVLLLWLFGMIAQGNLLSLDPTSWRWYSNTLQTIAVGWAVSLLLYLFTRTRTRLIVAATLLVVWGAVMMLAGADGTPVGLGLCGYGDWTPDGNLCEYIDRVVLGAHRDGATRAADGTPLFATWYRYTWLLSSMGFVVTVLVGELAGEVLCSIRHTPGQRALFLLVSGALLTAAGWGADALGAPVIKHIWSSSFVMVAAGYSLLALAAVYTLVDVLHLRRPFCWLKVWGCNAIVAYMMAEFPHLFSSVPDTLLWGLHTLLPDTWYGFVTTCATLTIPILILVILYRHRRFLRL